MSEASIDTKVHDLNRATQEVLRRGYGDPNKKLDIPPGFFVWAHSILLAHDPEKAGKIRTARDEIEIPKATFKWAEPYKVQICLTDLITELNDTEKWDALFQEHILSRLEITETEQKEVVKKVFISWYFHHKLVVIHPFNDGNGRLARLLMCILMLHQGLSFMTYPVLINRVVNENKTTYLNALSNSDNGNFIDPIFYMVEVLTKSFEETVNETGGLFKIRMRLYIFRKKLIKKVRKFFQG